MYTFFIKLETVSFVHMLEESYIINYYNSKQIYYLKLVFTLVYMLILNIAWLYEENIIKNNLYFIEENLYKNDKMKYQIIILDIIIIINNIISIINIFHINKKNKEEIAKE